MTTPDRNDANPLEVRDTEEMRSTRRSSKAYTIAGAAVGSLVTAYLYIPQVREGLPQLRPALEPLAVVSLLLFYKGVCDLERSIRAFGNEIERVAAHRRSLL